MAYPSNAKANGKPQGNGGSDITVAVGPDFGDAADDTSMIATATVTADAMAADYELVTATSAVSFDAAVDFAVIAATANVSELGYSADYEKGANSAANDGPDNWTNPNNATGANDGTNATLAGQALASTDANLRLGYADPGGGLETFTLNAVSLDFHTSQTGTVLNNGGLHHEYRLDGGAWTSLEVFTADVSNAPKNYDITAAVGGDWTKINNLEVRVRAVLGVGTNLVTCSVDAVELKFTASTVISDP